MKNNRIRLITFDFGRKIMIIPLSQLRLLYAGRYLVFIIIPCFLLSSCGSTSHPAPVFDRTLADSPQSVSRSDGMAEHQFYIVQKGDTFYSIALKHGIDRKELAEWNNIDDSSNLQPGQRISLSVPPKQQAQPSLFALSQATSPAIETVTQPSSGLPSNVDAASKLKTEPKAFKLPYSEQAVAQLQHPANPYSVDQTTNTVPVRTTENIARIEAAPKPTPQESGVALTDGAGWMWPATGELLSLFSNNSKGIKISGKIGQPIFASAAGDVVYSGSGLRGYGKLIIIKHNNAFLSAYAHNSKVLVKEGDTVRSGQKIAEMGNTDTDKVALHFEIRKHGKPVDPLKFLPGAGKSK